jgi:curved DNA-binding protein CbpA
VIGFEGEDFEMPGPSAASLARAYALLGVSPSTSNDDLVRAYKALVKRWHPDQYTNDAQGHAEASTQMREIC